MINNPFEDEGSDAMDDAKEREIQESLNRALPLPPVAFKPCCPECFSDNQRLVTTYRRNEETRPYKSKVRCGDCGLVSWDTDLINLRLLPSQPAPPYTQEEINQLAGVV